MPNAPKRICVRPGHPAYLGRRCPACDAEFEARRGTAAQRGYDAHWRRIRAWFLNLNPYCRFCGATATDVDHKVALSDGGARLDPANLRALCHSCHSARTGRDQVKAGIGRGR